MNWIKRLWKKHKIKQLRSRASLLGRWGRFGKAVELNELADRMECELKGVPYTKPEYTNPFLDDDGNLPEGFALPSAPINAKRGPKVHLPAGESWPKPPPSARPAFVYMREQADAERNEHGKHQN